MSKNGIMSSPEIIRGDSLVTSSLASSFMDLRVDNLVSSYISTIPDELQAEGFQDALALFHSAAERVPAYKDFLKKQGVKPELIKSKEDFQQVPVIHKKNYLTWYPLKDLCWDGKLENLFILSSSSGSTGEAFLWPRGEEQELEGGLNFEVIFKSIFQVDKYRTLYVINFAMGTWISGPFVLACAEYLSRKGYPITAITPGIDMNVTLSLLRKLGSNFDQIVISGYPPFIKDLLEIGEEEGFNWKKHRIRFLFAAEGFSEKFRHYIHEKVGIKDPLTGSVNIYGSADAAILANETPLTTQIRRSIRTSTKKVHSLFGDTRLPTLSQYDPRLKYFEVLGDRSIIFTSRAGIPLIRYSIGDTGGVCTFEEMEQKLVSVGQNLHTILDKDHKQYLWKLPFVYVFGRSDLTVSLYGLLVYPEHIKFGLEHSGLLAHITGKFVMSVEYTPKSMNQFLLIRVELFSGKKSSEYLSKKVQKAVIDGLEKINSEYAKLHDNIGDKALPHIELVENGNTEYFKRGTKQRWVKK